MNGPYYDRHGVTVHAGDCLDVLRDIPDASVHAVICDPPYGLADIRPAQVVTALTAWANGDREHVPNGRGFMGRDWDAFVPPPAVWDECLRVLTPGGHLVAFAGSRTYDLMGLSIRMAGFEIRDGLQWLYSQGMPKSRTQLKPAHEPIVLARAPFRGSEVANVAAHGTGALQVDACRTAHASAADLATSQAKNAHASFGSGPRKLGDTYQGQPAGDRAQYDGSAGRWPANVLLDEGAAAELDEQGEAAGSHGAGAAREHYTVSKPGVATNFGGGAPNGGRYGDDGGVSRFFPTFRYQAKAPASERPQIDGISHPTVKPLTLMRWLVRLVTPPGGLVLDPFAGSGTTLQAAHAEGFRAIGIEREPKYLPLIKARLDGRPRAATGTQTATDNEPMDLLDLLTEDGAA